jgi:hypothetical protein
VPFVFATFTRSSKRNLRRPIKEGDCIIMIVPAGSQGTYGELRSTDTGQITKELKKEQNTAWNTKK